MLSYFDLLNVCGMIMDYYMKILITIKCGIKPELFNLIRTHSVSDL